LLLAVGDARDRDVPEGGGANPAVATSRGDGSSSTGGLWRARARQLETAQDCAAGACGLGRIRCTHFEAALTIATMPARRAAGSRSPASMTAARSGAV